MNLTRYTDEQLAQTLTNALTQNNQTLTWQVEDECDRRDRYTPKHHPPNATRAEAALWYASQGLPVFPLKPGTKLPATRHGFKDATTNTTQIRQWWTQNPGYNLGLPTGGLFDVADLDGWEGVDTWSQLDNKPAAIGVVITPRRCGGGRHIYMQATGEGNKTRMRPGIDWRGLGGYVVAPPSKTPDGTYQWHRPLTLPNTLL